MVVAYRTVFYLQSCLCKVYEVGAFKSLEVLGIGFGAAVASHKVVFELNTDLWYTSLCCNFYGGNDVFFSVRSAYTNG